MWCLSHCFIGLVSLNSAPELAWIPLDLGIQKAAALYEARRGSSGLVLGDREVERVVKFAEVPHPCEHMTMSFTCLTTQVDVERRTEQTVRIYTDGSKIDGRVGASLSTWSVYTEAVKLRLSAYCTV